MEKTQVAIIGAGPAGTLLAELLHQGGVESVVLEQRSRAHVLARIRAGVLEHGSCEVLRHAGLGARMDREGHVHTGVNLAFLDRLCRIDFARLARSSVMIYGQTEVQKDLYDAADRRGQKIIFDAEDVRVEDAHAATPNVTYVAGGKPRRLSCALIAGCDGFHGISRVSIPGDVLKTYERVYPFGWLGVLSKSPPIHSELVYAHHARGFALCSMRNPELSRYYLQCPLDTNVDDWPDDRFFEELRHRLPEEIAAQLVVGPSVEKSIAPLRSFIAEPMRWGKLFLAGDAAHILPPTGAKGLNLAISDVVYLSEAFIEYFRGGASSALDEYSARALSRAWKAVRFSWWMTTLLHRFPDEGDFSRRIQEAELSYLAGSDAAQSAMAENYVGLPL